MPAQNDDRTVLGSQTSRRKTYQAPMLCCYGDVAAITQQVGNRGNKDGGQGNTSRTQP